MPLKHPTFIRLAAALTLALAPGLTAPAAEPAYPAYREIGPIDVAPTEPIEVSGTAGAFFKAAGAALERRAKIKLPPVSHPSSDGVVESLLKGSIHLGVVSLPLTPEEQEKFAHAYGFRLLEAKVAQDAVEVLVNAANPLETITIPRLRAIFEAEAAEGERPPIRRWAQLGGTDDEIHPFGGAGSWGTMRFFQREVMGSQAVRQDLKVEGVNSHLGVEKAVAEDPLAIGISAYQTPRPPTVRVLTIARRKGGRAFGTDPDTLAAGDYPLQRYFYLYLARPSLAAAEPVERELINLLLSAKGQAAVAQTGGLPLAPGEVREARAAVGLPR